VAIAQIEVQNRLSRATPRLPSAVTQQGVRVDKARSNFLMFVMLTSSNANWDPVALGDYAVRNIQPELLRVPGVGQVQLFGTEKAMRVWIDPQKLQGVGLSANDVNNAIRLQNLQVSAGSIGGLPNVAGQTQYATVKVNGQLSSVAQFGQILLRANADGSSVRLKDVARIEVAGQAYVSSSRLNGMPATGLGIQLSPTGNALATATGVRERMAQLKTYMPEGVGYDVPYDSSRFVRISIQEVVKTLVEAIVLVFIVMLVFLQNIRYTLIPTIVVPVALLGTFGVMLAMGFSINVLTLFGMVLAIGILVDDAIVVVENVERIMADEGLPPREATIKAMGQITGAIVGITVVLISCSCPWRFSAARWATSTASSRWPWWRPWCSRPPWRCRSRQRCAPRCSSRWRPDTTTRKGSSAFSTAASSRPPMATRRSWPACCRVPAAGCWSMAPSWRWRPSCTSGYPTRFCPVKTRAT